MIVLYSQTKGVKQKYILCISRSVAYRQYIHNSSSPVDSRLAHGGESTIYSSAPSGLVTVLPGLSALRLSAAESRLRNDSQTPEPAPLFSAGRQLPSRSPHWKGKNLRFLPPLSWLRCEWLRREWLTLIHRQDLERRFLEQHNLEGHNLERHNLECDSS